jgi:hypothetical protein
MSDMNTPLDPYRPPQNSTAASAPPRTGGRPGALTAICVIAIVLGAMGLLGALVGCGNLVLGAQIQQVFSSSTSPVADDQVDQIQEMKEEMIAVQGNYVAFNVFFVSLGFFVAAALLTGGSMALSLRPAGRTLLAAACAAAVVFELLRAVLDTIVKMEMFAVMTQHFEELIGQGGGAAGGNPELVIKTVAYVGLALGLGFALTKVVFYLISFVYLRKPQVRARFEAQDPTAGLV